MRGGGAGLVRAQRAPSRVRNTAVTIRARAMGGMGTEAVWASNRGCVLSGRHEGPASCPVASLPAGLPSTCQTQQAVSPHGKSPA
jgi:hypothetical protein